MYAPSKVADQEATTGGSNERTVPAAATSADSRQSISSKTTKKRNDVERLELDERAPFPRDVCPPTRNLDVVAENGLCNPSPQSQSSYKEGVPQMALDQPLSNQTATRGFQSELDSSVTIAGIQPEEQTSGDNDGVDEVFTHQESESYELLDISEFENDSSDSLPAAPPQSSSTSSTSATGTGSSNLQFNQSMCTAFVFIQEVTVLHELVYGLHSVSLSQWSRGEALRDCTGRPVEVCTLLV